MKRILVATAPFRMILGRITLILLTIIHLILPFTPANKHEGNQIIAGAVIIGMFFLMLTIASYKKPFRYIFLGLVLFWIVNFVAHLTNASPLSEGWPIKLIFSLALILGSVNAPKLSNE